MIITPLLVIFNIIVFVLLFLFINTIDKRKWLTVLVSLVLTPIVYFYLFYSILNIFSSYHHKKYFNAEAWKEKPTLRYEMSGDILNSDAFKGKTKKEVQEQLGVYEWLSWKEDLKAHDDNLWNYALGQKPGAFNEDKECLRITFKNDTVNTIETYTEKIEFNEEH